jgi:hypothetical protein
MASLHLLLAGTRRRLKTHREGASPLKKYHTNVEGSGIPLMDARSGEFLNLEREYRWAVNE